MRPCSIRDSCSWADCPRKYFEGVLWLANMAICILIQTDRLCPSIAQIRRKTGLMLRPLRLLSTLPAHFFCSRSDLLLENLAFRQQLAVLRQRRPQPRFAVSDRLLWDDVAAALVCVETGVDSRPTGDCCVMASCRIQSILDQTLKASSVSRAEVRKRWD